MQRRGTCLFLEVGREGGDGNPVNEVAPGGGELVERLDDDLHRCWGLCVGELNAGDADEDLAAGQDDVLRQQPHYVQGVGTGDLLHVDNELKALDLSTLRLRWRGHLLTFYLRRSRSMSRFSSSSS